jgi:hypothetical protein
MHAQQNQQNNNVFIIVEKDVKNNIMNIDVKFTIDESSGIATWQNLPKEL